MRSRAWRASGGIWAVLLGSAFSQASFPVSPRPRYAHDPSRCPSLPILNLSTRLLSPAKTRSRSVFVSFRGNLRRCRWSGRLLPSKGLSQLLRVMHGRPDDFRLRMISFPEVYFCRPSTGNTGRSRPALLLIKRRHSRRIRPLKGPTKVQ